MLSIVRRLRTALDLAERLERVERDVTEIKFEWTDTLDKLLAREERWRKRYKTEMTRALAEPENVAAHSGDRKAALRNRIASLRAQG